MACIQGLLAITYEQSIYVLTRYYCILTIEMNFSIMQSLNHTRFNFICKHDNCAIIASICANAATHTE